MDTNKVCDTKFISRQFAISASHIFYKNAEGSLCYQNLFTKKETITAIKCLDISAFADFVATTFYDNIPKTKLFKVTFQKVVEVVDFDKYYMFSTGVLRNSNRYILPIKSLEEQTGLLDFVRDNQFYSFLGATDYKDLITDEMI